VTATAAPARRLGPARVAAVVLLGLVLVAIAAGRPSGRGEALDPEGTGPLGARGLVLVLEELGAEVDVVEGPPPADADTAVVLRDRYGPDDVAGALDWVEDGGVLVVADPFSPLGDDAFAAEGAGCPAAIDDVRRLELADGVVARRDGARCFGGAVVAGDVGDGTVVVLDQPDPLLNDLLDEHDNAVLAAALLAPTPGTRVAFVVGPSPGADDGTDSLLDLVSSPVRQGLVQGGIAVLVWVAWRARRLGRPVVEEQPVAVAGSELVVAVGRLLDARRQPHEAATVLRAETRRQLAARLGLPADADTKVLAAAVAGRGGADLRLDVDRIAAALGERPVHADGDLLDVAADLDQIRTAVLGRRPT
jgi:hypothetical protein